MTAKLEHHVSRYDAQREGMTIVSGWQVLAQVTPGSGRKFVAAQIAVCSSKDDADEIAELLNAKYAEES